MKDYYETGEQSCRLDSCLFFSTAMLARVFGKIAEDAFRKTGLSPSHALLLYMVNCKEGIHQKELGEQLHLTPSTITRFIEKLERKGFVRKKSEGKKVYLYTTKEGLALQSDIIQAWSQLHDRYYNILTEEETMQFIRISSKLLEQFVNKTD